MKHTWTIKADDAGERLDVFLAAQLDGLTRSAVARLLKKDAGQVNGKTASVHCFLRTGDKIEFDDAGRRTQDAGRALELPPPDVEVVDETGDWLVLNKPAGLLVHPDRTHASGTLVDFLLAEYPAIAKIGEDPERPGIVHRLDKDVSGLMVIAKTQDAFDSLKQQFKEHTVDKTYLALVHGQVRQDAGDIKFRIAHSKTYARMAAHPVDETTGRAAWTHYKVLRRLTNATLLELQILTGRTHQIRAHLFALQHPVFGDTLYKLRLPTSKLPSPRLLLQAVELAFNDPATGQRKKYSLAPDPAFDQLIKNL